MRKRIALIALVACAPLVTGGCFGGFELTRKVYRFNAEAHPDKWVRWGYFLALNIIPFYSGAVVLDTVLLNSVEFWTGENPGARTTDSGTRRFVTAEGGSQATLLGDGSLQIRAWHNDGRERVFRLVKEDAAVAAYDLDGVLIARASDVGGVPTLID